MRLHKDEIKDMLLASAALIFIFSYPEFLSQPSLLFASAMAIASGFVLHELAHRFVANKFGVTARFAMWKEGLAIALILAIATNGSFVFAAPGAVMINSVRFSLRGLVALGKKEYGIISAAGPVTNLFLAAAFALLHSSTADNLFLYAAHVNVSLALFNMIPIPPLDGSKVISWSLAVWAVIIAAIALFRIFLA
ncbi:MAG: site-2 protease family protein [Candidatus Aenigmarchaeota archaeon]|nr:site-2 protease family protein [Candidatus Aenigmarchaeota archaeon]